MGIALGRFRFPSLAGSTDLSLHVLLQILIVLVHLDVVLEDARIVLVSPGLGKGKNAGSSTVSMDQGSLLKHVWF